MTNSMPGAVRRLGVLTLLFLSLAGACAGASRVFPEGAALDDVRLQPWKTLDGYFPFTPPKAKADWEKRADQVRRRILVSQGLWPMPARTPLRPVLHGKVDRGDYTVEKVFFESAPGFFVTGNLYRPKNIQGKAPGVLFAHGHWANARLSESDDAELFREIAEGQERFVEGGRSRFQSMCVQLARMGCVVWQWDMLGNSDAQQLSMELVHGFKKQRPEMSTPADWGLFSPQAEAHLQSAMGLQTWNSIRSLDFLLTLPEVDPARVACTGASGGGTQTFILAGIDSRVTLAFPAVMVSTAMQGGCTCENASLLRVGTGNIEIAGLFAPKPMGMTTANDWTKEMATKGFPELRQLYTLLGAADKVSLHRGEHFPHNYNAVSRIAFYNCLNRHFKLGFKEPVLERDYERLSRAELTVWDAQHPAPKAGDPDFERQLLRGFHEDAQRQISEAAKSPAAFKALAGPALETIIGRTLAEAGEVKWETVDKADRGKWVQLSGLLKNTTYHETLPVVWCQPHQGNGTTVLCFSGKGKASLFKADGTLEPDLQRLVEGGANVLGIDLFGLGEFEGKKPSLKFPRETAAYVYGYNDSLFAQRVHDVLNVVKLVQTDDRLNHKITVLAIDGVGPVVAAARALCGNAITRAVIRTAGFDQDRFRFGESTNGFEDPNFVPGGAKYGDLPGMLALAAPASTLLVGETAASVDLTMSIYREAGAAGKLELMGLDDPAMVEKIVRYLSGNSSPP